MRFSGVFGGHLGFFSIKMTTKYCINVIIKFLDINNIIINTNNGIILYLEGTLWKIIDLYVHGGHLGFWKSHAGGEWPHRLSFNDTHRTIEKSKEMIAKRPNEIIGPASEVLLDWLVSADRLGHPRLLERRLNRRHWTCSSVVQHPGVRRIQRLSVCIYDRYSKLS